MKTRKPDHPTTDVVPDRQSLEYRLLTGLGLYEDQNQRISELEEEALKFIDTKYALETRIIVLKSLLLDLIFCRVMRVTGISMGAFLGGVLIADKCRGQPPMSWAVWIWIAVLAVAAFGGGLWIEVRQARKALKQAEQKE